MVKSRGIHHVNLNVHDVPRSLKFYQEAFGLEIDFWEGNQMVFLRSPGVSDMLTLCQAPPGAPVGPGGVSHFGFRVSNAEFDEAVAQIERAGGKLKSRGKHGGVDPFAYFEDPDGYVIELGAA